MKRVPSTLEDLISPLSETEFLTLLRDRQVTFLRGAQPDRFRALLDWQSLIAMISRGAHPHNLAEFCLAKESAVVPPERWLAHDPVSGGNKVDLGKLLAFVNQGVSLIIQPVDPYVPALAALCQSIRESAADQIKAGVIVTQGRGGAFKLHYDPEDLIILQVEGSKRWRIYGPPVSNPVAGMPPQTPPPEDVPIFDGVLRPGDALIVPGGNWHHCEGGAGRSLHLTIFFTPPTVWHAVKELTSQLLTEDPFVQPVTRLLSAQDRAALEEQVKARAKELIDGLDLNAFLASWNGRQA